MNGDAHLLGVRAHLGLGPGHDGVDLADPPVLGVPLDLGDVGPRDRLFAAQARDPAVELSERAAERRDLADAAALVSILERIPEAVEALLALERLHRLAVGELPLDLEVVLGAHALGGHVRLVGQAPGVEREDPHRGRHLVRDVDDHAVLDRE